MTKFAIDLTSGERVRVSSKHYHEIQGMVGQPYTAENAAAPVSLSSTRQVRFEEVDGFWAEDSYF